MIGYGIKETTTTTGTGTLTLAAVSGFPRFSNAFADTDLCLYSILDSTGAPIECGIGTYTASNTLARTYPTVTWNGSSYLNADPSALSLAAGTKTVICTGIPGFQGRPFQGVNSTIDANKTSGGSNTIFGVTSGAVTALRLYLMPYELSSVRPLTAITCRISIAAAAGKLLRMGLYQIKADGALGKLLFQSTDIAADATGLRTYTLGASTYYPPGWYAVAFVCDGTPTVNMTNINPTENIFGVDGNNVTIQAVYTGLGSLVMPDPYVGGITTVTQGSVPILHMRV